MTKKKNDGTHADYDVGYGRPPKASRFTKGRSGNPKGRPRGSRNFKTEALEVLYMPIDVKFEGKTIRVSTQKAALLALRQKALGGDLRALADFNRIGREYNSEEGIIHPGSSTGDDTLLAIFAERMTSGAFVPAQAEAGLVKNEPAASASVDPGTQASAPTTTEANPKAGLLELDDDDAWLEGGPITGGDKQCQ